MATVREAVAEADSIPKAAMRRLAPELAMARQELERDFSAWLARNAGADRFTAQRYRALLIQVRLLSRKASRWPGWLARLRDAVHDALARSGTLAGRMALGHLVRELAMFTDKVGDLPLSRFAAAVEMEPGKLLMTRFEASARRYAGKVGDDIRRELRVGVIRGETIFELTTRLRKLGGPFTASAPEGLFKRYEYWAERLARTEAMNAYNALHERALREAVREDPELRKRWDASADRRLCAICQALDGEVADVGEEFRGGYGRPPAHPNCRCVLTPWKDSWKQAARAA